MNISQYIYRLSCIITFEKLRYKIRKYIKKEGYFINEDIEFLVFLPANDFYYLPYFQLYNYKNVQVSFSYVNSNTIITSIFKKLPRFLKYRKYTKAKYVPSKKYVLFFDGLYSLASLDFREYIREKYFGCSIIFHLGDLLATKKGISINDIKEFSDLVVTFDHNDAERYGLLCHADPYSVLNRDMLNVSGEKTQLIFYGYAKDKDRAQWILQVYDKMRAHNVKCDFSVIGLNDEDIQKRPELADASFTPYLDYLSKVQSSDCLLEILQDGMSGATFRTWEAVVYNKKLITNNQSVKDEEFYNPQYIQVIDSIDSLDMEWLKNDVKVDYGYSGKLSPRSCFEYYLSMLN